MWLRWWVQKRVLAAERDAQALNAASIAGTVGWSPANSSARQAANTPLLRFTQRVCLQVEARRSAIVLCSELRRICGRTGTILGSSSRWGTW